MKTTWAILALLSMVSFGIFLPIYLKKSSLKPASSVLSERTKGVVDKNPRLKADWDKAMEDGVLTWSEANSILEKVGEKADPED
ncbi:MAG: hypothetical protein K2R98_02935 [Gemmataceae bacterium]|nr:hypothetical protein [Gemmataceae bacterium]